MPHKSPYARFDTESLTLRDVLAVDRTIVANERTFLGYIRTTLALLAAGGSLLHFVSELWATIAAMCLIGISVPMFVIGLRHYLVRRSTLAPLMRMGDAPAAASAGQDDAVEPGLADEPTPAPNVVVARRS